MRHTAIVITLVGLTWPAWGKSPLPESALEGHLRWGECILEIDEDGPKTLPSTVWPILCVRPQVSSQVIFRDDKGDRNLAMHHASVYHGFHLHRLISVHGQYIGKRIFRFGQKTDRVIDTLRTEELYLQLGNIAEDRWRLSTGLVDLPFGLDYRPLMEAYDELIKSRKYWKSPRYGSVLTYDTQVSSQYEVGYGTDRLDPETAVVRNGEESDNEAVALRAMYDVAALDGFRFAFSGYGDRMGERRVGVGLVNIARRGDESVFEYVHLRPQPSREDNFDQLFRFGYRGAMRTGMRWVAEYESDRSDYRMGTIGFDIILPDYGLFRMATSYHRGWFRDQDDFLVVASSIRLAI